jgi:hypothetical protein
MAEEPSLPQLPHGNENGLKRVRLNARSDSPVISSDPPLFSSDDDPSAENYAGGGRQKKRFRGPWYSQRPLPMRDAPAKITRKFERNFDSAVFMGSDSTEADEDAEFSSRIEPPGFSSSSQLQVAMRPPPAPQTVIEPTPEMLAEEYMQSFLDSRGATIDLSRRGLTKLSNHIFEPLHYYVQGTERAVYVTMETHLSIFLSANELTRVPGEICNLGKLVNVLSLRNNKLVELPAGIERWSAITELNIANNNLRYLPFELLQLLLVST